MKTLSRLLAAFQVLLLAGAGALYYLCKKSMNVARYIIYISRKWQAALNLDALFYSFMALITVVACWQIICGRIRGKPLKLYVSWLTLFTLDLLILCFILIFRKSGLRPYYQLLCIFCVIMSLQALKAQARKAWFSSIDKSGYTII